KWEERKMGYINKSGQEVIPLKYDDASYSFSEGKALVKLKDKEFYIDREGRIQKDFIKYFYSNVDLIEATGQYDQNGERTGVWKEYYKNGQLKEVCSYINGKKNGIFKKYYE